MRSEIARKICVAGLWHLGSVTAASLAAGGHDVTGLDEDATTVIGLRNGKPPLFEPGLAELLSQGIAAGRLAFTTDPQAGVADADIVWVTYDTPVDEADLADVDFVLNRVKKLLPLLKDGCLVLISSQLPVGSTRALASHYEALATRKRVTFGYAPENLRLGQAIGVFTRPDRVVVGLEDRDDQDKVKALLRPFTTNIVFMSVESAEMTKHGINAFLAMSVAFANELATVCEAVGADAGEVARGLKTESRIGPGAYVSPGVAFSGGTLARDIAFLSALGRQRGVDLSLLPAVKTSNDHHRHWPLNRLKALLGDLPGRRIAILGLTYKPGTDTLRRSYALELSRLLHAQGATLSAYDPKVKTLPKDIDVPIALAGSATEAVAGADAALIATEWPEFREEDWNEMARTMRTPILLDPKGHLDGRRANFTNLTYVIVGRLGGGEAA